MLLFYCISIYYYLFFFTFFFFKVSTGEYKGLYKMIYDSEPHNGVIINQLPAVGWKNNVNNHTSLSQMPTKRCSRTSQTINESGKTEIHQKSQMRIAQLILYKRIN